MPFSDYDHQTREILYAAYDAALLEAGNAHSTRSGPERTDGVSLRESVCASLSRLSARSRSRARRRDSA